jgi:AbrB family looped-hinge helix DNA binding protein
MPPVSTLSSKGQLVIPSALRKQAGLSVGDALELDYDAKSDVILVRKLESPEEYSTRISKYIRQGTVPLTDAGGYYSDRKARL